MKLKNMIAVVIGGMESYGGTIAELMKKEGAKVYAIDTFMGKTEDIVVFPAKTSDGETVKRIIEWIAEENNGRIDIIINNPFGPNYLKI